MMSNSPCVPVKWFKRAQYRAFPHDIRPSKVAGAAAHLGGTLVEIAAPLVLLFSTDQAVTRVAVGVMRVHHDVVHLAAGFLRHPQVAREQRFVLAQAVHPQPGLDRQVVLLRCLQVLLFLARLRHAVHEIEHAGFLQQPETLVDAHRLAGNARCAAAVATDQ